jgi:hypothetical protein
MFVFTKDIILNRRDKVVQYYIYGLEKELKWKISLYQSITVRGRVGINQYDGGITSKVGSALLYDFYHPICLTVI